MKLQVNSAISSSVHPNHPIKHAYDNSADTFFFNTQGWARFGITSSYVAWVWMQNRRDCCGESPKFRDFVDCGN